MKSYLIQRVELFSNFSFRSAVFMGFSRALGVGMIYVVLSWHLLSIYNSIDVILIFMVTWWISGPLLSPITGYIADRFNRVKIIIFCNILSGFILVAFLIFGNSNSLFDIYFMTSLWGIVFAFYMPANLVLVREIFTSDEQLLYANSTIDGVFEIGMVVGMSLGGLLLPYINLKEILGIILVITLFSVMFSFNIKTLRETKKNTDGFIKSWTSILFYMKERKFLVWLYFGEMLFTCLFMIAPIFISPYAKNILQTNSLGFGLIETGFSAGFIIGSVLMPYLAEKIGDTKALIIALLISSACYLALVFNNLVSVAVILYFSLGLFMSSWAIVVTLAQKNTDINLQGKAQGLFYGMSGLIVLKLYIIFGLVDYFHPIPVNMWYIFLAVLALFTLGLIVISHKMLLKSNQ